MPDLIRFSDLKDSHPLTLDGNNDLFAIAVKNPSSETGYTSQTVLPNQVAGYVAEDATYVNLKTGASDNTVVKAINKTLENFADEFNTTAGSTYNKDDCVIYDGVLYQCTNPSGTTSGTFVTADWTQVRAVDVGTGGGGGGSADHITLTQAQYDALVQAGTVDPTAYYFISDAALPANHHDYSTNEQVVGTWIDGSTIYEKTIQTSVNVDLTSLSIDVMVEITGTVNHTNGKWTPVSYASSDRDYAVPVYDSTTNILTVAAVGTANGGTWYVTLRYTKSSS